jgi:hypothetical protein
MLYSLLNNSTEITHQDEQVWVNKSLNCATMECPYKVGITYGGVCSSATRMNVSAFEMEYPPLLITSHEQDIKTARWLIPQWALILLLIIILRWLDII